MNEFQEKLDRIWTELEALHVDVAVIKTIVSNDHEHRLKRLENLLWFLIGTVIVSNLVQHFALGIH